MASTNTDKPQAHSAATDTTPVVSELVPHLFRTEFRKMCAGLCRKFGAQHVDLAEDIVGEVFARALEGWSYTGLPPNPTAWLYTVARNLAANHWKRTQLFAQTTGPEWQQRQERLQQQQSDSSNDTHEWDAADILDAELRMLFVCCHPALTESSQIAFALRVLCGFSATESATALCSTEEAVERRLRRAKNTLREEHIDLDLPHDAELRARLRTVCTTLYLLFSEGYYSEHHESVLREDLCAEAMRLVELLMSHPVGDQPIVHALYALMCFQSSRFAARWDAENRLVYYDEQDIALWDRELISKGTYFMNQAGRGTELSDFHLEAAIAYWTTQPQADGAHWREMLKLYDLLIQQKNTEVVALNRILVLQRAGYPRRAQSAFESGKWSESVFRYLLAAELQPVEHPLHRHCLEQALKLCRQRAERERIEERLRGL